jgi:hypothetical protein
MSVCRHSYPACKAHAPFCIVICGLFDYLFLLPDNQTLTATFFTTRRLGAFAKLRKATISFVMSVCLSVCPSVRMEQLGFHWTYFYEM